MRKYRYIIAIIAIVATAFVSYGLFTSPKIEPAESQSFSAERTAADIKVISQEHHSIEHPENRAVVRKYWFDKLSAMEGVEPQLLKYDSVALFNDKPIDIEDIYCKVDPIIADPNAGEPTYVLLMAHIDSRFAQKVLKDTVYSYGAADNGYGCAVITEALSLALKYRGEWRQGVKLLLTDSEEYQLLGVKTAIEKNSEIFENVGLVINVDARGNKGPALLFETGDNNAKVMELYTKAKYPYTYSFTSVVYRMMPNFTDYSPLKADYPGMNFSTIDDLNHYHTDLDNYSNISLYSLQHYGAQIEPIMSEYLTNHQYRDASSLKADNDAVAFTIPLLGMFKFSKGGYILVNAIVFALFCLVFCFSLLSGRIRSKGVFVQSLKMFIYAIVAFGVGTLVAFIFSKIEGANFKLMGLIRGVQYDEWVVLGSVVLLFIVFLLLYIKQRKKSSDTVSSSAIRRSASASGATKYSFKVLYAILIVDVVLSIGAFIYCGENFFFMAPVAVACASLLLWKVTRWRGVLLVGIVTILLLAFSFTYIVAMALTMGALGVTLLISFLFIALIVPMADLYCRKEKSI